MYFTPSDVGYGRKREQEAEVGRERETDRQTDRERQRETEREREREREREGERERERERECLASMRKFQKETRECETQMACINFHGHHYT